MFYCWLGLGGYVSYFIIFRLKKDIIVGLVEVFEWLWFVVLVWVFVGNVIGFVLICFFLNCNGVNDIFDVLYCLYIVVVNFLM